MQFLLSLICNLPSILLALLGLGILIAFHEFGHLIFAKIFNVYAPSFSIGFGPQVIKKKIGETIYQLSALPLGGYVEMAGAQEVGQGEQKYAQDTTERSFSQKAYWQKMIIISAGIIFNLLLAYVLLAILFLLGAPCLGPTCNQYQPLVLSISSQPDSLAHAFGIQANDIIKSINNHQVTTIAETTNLLNQLKHAPREIIVERKSNDIVLTATKTDNTHQQTAAKPDSHGFKLGLFWKLKPQNLTNSLKLAGQMTWSTIRAIFTALKGIKATKGEGLGGPLRLIKVITDCVNIGFKMFLFMLAFVSINLAVFNVLPLPIFDGGQALFYTIEAMSGKPLSDKTRHLIHLATWIFVIGLIVYLTYSDVLFLYQPTKP